MADPLFGTKALTKEDVMDMTKRALGEVRQLNAWNLDLHDVSIIQELPNAEVLSLSVNRIDTLSSFRGSKKLTELYLRRNYISELEELVFLKVTKMLELVKETYFEGCMTMNEFRRHLTSL